MNISKEDFDQWRASPVTERVSAALRKLAERNKEQWVASSWEGQNCNPIELAQCKARYETAMDLSELTYEQMEGIFDDEEPKRDKPDRVQGADRAEKDG